MKSYIKPSSIILEVEDEMIMAGTTELDKDDKGAGTTIPGSGSDPYSGGMGAGGYRSNLWD